MEAPYFTPTVVGGADFNMSPMTVDFSQNNFYTYDTDCVQTYSERR